jgi:hypothetical protein
LYCLSSVHKTGGSSLIVVLRSAHKTWGSLIFVLRSLHNVPFGVDYVTILVNKW